MLAQLTRDVTLFDGKVLPTGTPGRIVRTARGTILFRARELPRTVAVQEGDFEPASGIAFAPRPLLPTPVRHLAVGDVVKLQPSVSMRPDALDAPECACGCGVSLVGQDALPTRAERAELAAAPPWLSDPSPVQEERARARRVPGWAFLALALIPLALAAVAVAVSP